MNTTLKYLIELEELFSRALLFKEALPKIKYDKYDDYKLFITETNGMLYLDKSTGKAYNIEYTNEGIIPTTEVIEFNFKRWARPMDV